MDIVYTIGLFVLSTRHAVMVRRRQCWHFRSFIKSGCLAEVITTRVSASLVEELYQGTLCRMAIVSNRIRLSRAACQGHLLLEHGRIDDNVHPVETMRFVDGLMKANKSFDLLFVPNMFHGESGEHDDYPVRRHCY